MRLSSVVRAAVVAGALVALAVVGGCADRREGETALVVAIAVSPNNLDPRVGSDEASQRVHHLLFNSLVTLDEELRVVPELATSIETPDPTTYVVRLRSDVRFHDGRRLTSADVAYTFNSLLDATLVSPKRGAYSVLDSVTAGDETTVVFRLKAPFGSFPVNLVMGIVPDGATNVSSTPIGTGPYRLRRFQPDGEVVLERFDGYFDGTPPIERVTLKVVPDNTMIGLELLKGTADMVVNDLAPDVVHQLRRRAGLKVIEAPGIDYAYVGVNLRDEVMRDVRVRQALAFGTDPEAIVHHLRRGLATVARGILPPVSWAAARDLPAFTHDPDRARRLLDEAGWPDPDGDGPGMRLRLQLKVSNAEFARLQAAVLQDQLRVIGIDLDVRTYEFSTLYADVLRGAFQLFSLQWAGVTDPDMLRRVFHSAQMPPLGFNRGFFADREVDAALDRAARAVTAEERLEQYRLAQHLVADAVPYVSLWHKTNVVVAAADLEGISLLPTASFAFLRHVSRVSPSTQTH